MTQAEQIEELKYLLIQALPADSGFTPPPQCMPDEYKQVDTVQAYRAYYTQAKRDLADVLMELDKMEDEDE